MARKLKTAESDIETTACKLILEHLGVEGSKLKIIGEDGFNDRIFWVPGGKPVFIEFKQPGEKPKAHQTKIHDRLGKLGYLTYTCDSAYLALYIVIQACKTHIKTLSLTQRKVLEDAEKVYENRIAGQTTGKMAPPQLSKKRD